MRFAVRLLLFVVFLGPAFSLLAAEKLSGEAIADLARASSDADSFIDKLLARYPELLERKALAYRSRSPEKDSTSSKYPRALLTNKTGDVFVAFNGDPKKPDYNKIQIIDPQTGAIEINFDSKSKIRGPVISKNPESCIECHGTDRNRLIFDSYDLWPGFFGSNEARSTPKSEYPKWREFRRTSAGRGRYKKLFDKKSLHIEDEKVGFLARQFPSVQLASMGEDVSAFSSVVIVQTLKRIARTIKETPEYPRLKYAYLAAAMACSNFEAFIPPELKARAKKSYKEVEALTAKNVETYQDNRARNYARDKGVDEQNNREEDVIYSRKIAAKLRFLYELSGRDADQWSPTFDAGSYSFEGANLEISLIQKELTFGDYEKFEVGNYAFRSLSDEIPHSGCDELLKDYQKSQGSRSKTPSAASHAAAHASSIVARIVPVSIESGSKIVQERCLRCHAKSDDNGFVADDPSDLRKKVALDPRYLDLVMARLNPELPRVERMPKTGESLSLTERQALKIFLQNQLNSTTSLTVPVSRDEALLNEKNNSSHDGLSPALHRVK